MKQVLLLLIRFYRKCISPLFPPVCRYYPTCSTYAMEAIMRFGAWKGTYLAVRRLLHCHPWSPGGVDYVPDQFPSIRVRFLSAHTLRVSSHPRFAGSWRSACKRRTAIKRFLSASNCRKLRDRNAEEGMYDQYDVSVRFVWEAVRLDHASDL